MHKAQSMLIYNVFPLLSGTFSQWSSHFRRAADMGFNWIFVNPIQYPGFSGSLYSLKDYFAFNPLFLDEDAAASPEQQCRDMIQSADALGLSMMVDLVINHCAVDSPLIEEHPEWFAFKDGKIENPFAMDDGKKVVWGDLARFDHHGTSDPEGMYAFFKSVVDHLIALGFRGFRCDAAYQVPRGIWERLIRETRAKHPEVMFFAETLGCSPEQTRETARAGFDFIFNSSKWWDLSSPWLMKQYDLTRETAPSVSFPESHDTERLADEFNGNESILRQRYLFSALFATGVMIPMGFEFGFRKRMHVVQSRPSDWEQTATDLSAFISSINALKRHHEVFQHECETQIITVENPAVLVMKKKSALWSERALIVLNKDFNHPQHFNTQSVSALIAGSGELYNVTPGQENTPVGEPYHCELAPGEGLVFIRR